MTEIEVRRAKPDDAEALVRLRALMLAAVGVDVGAEDAPWRQVALGFFTEGLASPAFRWRGLAKACVIALLDWYRDETEAGQIELHATEQGDSLYRALGFVETSYPAQRLTIVR